MKSIVFLILYLSVSNASYAQNPNKNLIGKWQSINDKNLILLFTSSIERKYYLNKSVKRVPIYNIQQPRILVKGNLINEQQSGGGGIDETNKFEILNDTLVIYYQKNTLKYSFKRITDKQFQLLTGRKF